MAQRRLARIAAGLVLGFIVLGSRGAHADERTEARGHFKKGMAAIADGRYEVGIEELKSAYDILPHPNVLYNIARAYVDSGDIENAVLYYRKYLEGAPKDRDEVAQMVASLEERIRKQQAMLVEAQQQAPAGAVPAPGTPGAAPGATPSGAGAAALPAAPSAGDLRTDQVFEETVVTASRTAQSPLDAPNSTSIITEQDIRLSGITKIPEMLRRLAGVDIMETTGAQTEVSMRGFNQRLSNKVLVLIDGRSVYTDLLGATLWSDLPVSIEDIERIEVVRGPGSALYGADAFNGVVNIITKPPGEGKTGVNVGYGDHNASHTALWANTRDGELGYRITAGYDYQPRWSREVPPDTAVARPLFADQNVSLSSAHATAEVTRHFGKDVTAGIFGAYQDGTTEILGVGPVNDIVIKGNSTQAAAWVNAKHFELRSFWTYTGGQSGLNAAYVGATNLLSIYHTNVVDVEGQYIDSFETGRGVQHDLHIGANYRVKQVDWTYLYNEEVENHFGLFFHDEVKIGKQLAVVGDYRADYVPYLQRVVQSPRASVLVHPTEKSTIRGIVATAFRTPNFLESYIGLPVRLPVSGATLDGPHVEPKLRPEQIFTTELGYLNSESDFFTFDSAFFYNHASNLIEVSPNSPITVGDLLNSNQPTGLSETGGSYTLFTGGFENQCQRYDVFGSELGVRTFPIEGLDVYANYTLMKVSQNDDDCTPGQKSLLANDARTSAHKLNTGVQLRTKIGIDAEVDFHYVSPQDWAEQVTNVQKQQIEYQSFHLNAYTLLNARVGFRFYRNKAEISGVAFNLLDDQHREHPFGQIIDRRLMGFFTYRF